VSQFETYVIHSFDDVLKVMGSVLICIWVEVITYKHRKKELYLFPFHMMLNLGLEIQQLISVGSWGQPFEALSCYWAVMQKLYPKQLQSSAVLLHFQV